MIIPKISFPIYAIFILLAFVAGMTYIYFSLKKRDYIYLYFLLSILLSFIFGKLFSVVASSGEINFINAGLSSYGGVLGVVLSSLIFENIVKLDNNLIKYSILSLPLVYGISKIGCFFTGCCYGIPYDGIFYVTYTDGLNDQLFPIQILETIIFIIVFTICNYFKNKGSIIEITIFVCATSKFLLDFLRYEHINKVITTNQIVSLMLMLAVVIILIIKRIKQKKND